MNDDKLIDLIADWMSTCAAMDPYLIPSILNYAKALPDCDFKQSLLKAHSKQPSHIESLREILFLMMTSKVFRIEEVLKAFQLALEDYTKIKGSTNG